MVDRSGSGPVWWACCIDRYKPLRNASTKLTYRHIHVRGRTLSAVLNKELHALRLRAGISFLAKQRKRSAGATLLSRSWAIAETRACISATVD